MGYPLLDHQKNCLGAMVIPSYDMRYLYTDEDQALFRLIADTLSNALQQFKAIGFKSLPRKGCFGATRDTLRARD